jgi:hypothetical protein
VLFFGKTKQLRDGTGSSRQTSARLSPAVAANRGENIHAGVQSLASVFCAGRDPGRRGHRLARVGGFDSRAAEENHHRRGSEKSNLPNSYRTILARSGVDVDVRLTNGAVENLALLNDPHSGVAAGIV